MWVVYLSRLFFQKILQQQQKKDGPTSLCPLVFWLFGFRQAAGAKDNFRMDIRRENMSSERCAKFGEMNRVFVMQRLGRKSVTTEKKVSFLTDIASPQNGPMNQCY